MRWASRAGVVVVAVRTNKQASKTERPRIEQQETVPRYPVSVATGNHGYQIDGKRPPEKGSIQQHLVRRCECNCFTKALVRSCSSSSASDRALLCRGSRSRLNFSNQWLEVASRTQASNRQETRTEEDLNSRGRKREWGGGGLTWSGRAFSRGWDKLAAASPSCCCSSSAHCEQSKAD